MVLLFCPMFFVSVLALSVCSLRSHPHSPFCRCATSSPGAGEVFPQRERPWQRDEVCVDCQGLPLWGSWHRVAMTERASPLTVSLFIRKGCCMKRCAAALWEVFPLRMPTKQRKRFSIYALRPARPLPALFSLRTRSFWCLRWLGVGWGSLASPARLLVWATSGSMRSSVHS